jgi:hypothetical protein
MTPRPPPSSRRTPTGGPGGVREGLRALVRALARAAAVEEYRRRETPVTSCEGQEGDHEKGGDLRPI